MYMMIWIKPNIINLIKYHYTPQTVYISAGIYVGKYHELTSVYEGLVCRIVGFDQALTILASDRLTRWIHKYIRKLCKMAVKMAAGHEPTVWRNNTFLDGESKFIKVSSLQKMETFLSLRNFTPKSID
jgi:hypothetical protein